MKRLAVGLCLAIFASGSVAQQATPAPCTTDQYRQFDFWLGDWDVVDSNDQNQGTNLIESILGGCVIRETWTGTSMRGASHNVYDRTTGQWHQTWVDTGGNLLQIDGGMQGDSMVLEGDGVGPDGSMVLHRITWTLLEDGRVRQHWQTSADGDAWNDAFLGFYTKKGDS